MAERIGPEEIRAARGIVRAKVHETPCLSFRSGAARVSGGALFLKCETVSYTHLTLPTICSV